MIDDNHYPQVVLDGTRTAVTHRGLHGEEAIDKTRQAQREGSKGGRL